AQCVALADRIDTLVGIFGIGQKPSGEKDPFALRRASLGILRICIEESLPLDLNALLGHARDQYANKLSDCDIEEILDYVYDRLPGYYAEQDIPKDAILSALSSNKDRPLDIHHRIQAIQQFRILPEAEALIAGNKRIHNILRKVEGNLPENVDPGIFEEACEHELHDQVRKLSKTMLVEDYIQRMKQLASLQQPIDAFFDQVMVMTEDKALRDNRIALLNQTHRLFMQIADLSKLQ
ncbi:MAG: glycine--tRNA ligase subunit beta, partial [Gammaproteobacteria bacterium]